jgi:hypothetical protein
MGGLSFLLNRIPSVFQSELDWLENTDDLCFLWYESKLIAGLFGGRGYENAPFFWLKTLDFSFSDSGTIKNYTK